MKRLTRFLLLWILGIAISLEVIFYIAAQRTQVIAAAPLAGSSYSLTLVSEGWMVCSTPHQGTFYIDPDIQVRQTEINRAFYEPPDDLAAHWSLPGLRMVRWNYGQADAQMISIRHSLVIAALAGAILLAWWKKLRRSTKPVAQTENVSP